MPSLQIIQPQIITSGWPPCCVQKFEENDTEMTSKQKSASRWIGMSLIKWYLPCNSCAYDITRRCGDVRKQSIWSKLQWNDICTANNASLTDMTVKDLVKAGATVGAQDFMNFILSHKIDGVILTRLLNEETSLPTKMDILQIEWDRIELLLSDLNVSTECITVENSKIFNAMPINAEYKQRIRESSGVFGKYGKQFGGMGRDADGMQAWCAEQGKEKGGRKKGGKNLMSLSNKFSNMY